MAQLWDLVDKLDNSLGYIAPEDREMRRTKMFDVLASAYDLGGKDAQSTYPGPLAASSDTTTLVEVKYPSGVASVQCERTPSAENIRLGIVFDFEGKVLSERSLVLSTAAALDLAVRLVDFLEDPT